MGRQRHGQRRYGVVVNVCVSEGDARGGTHEAYNADVTRARRKAYGMWASIGTSDDPCLAFIVFVAAHSIDRVPLA